MNSLWKDFEPSRTHQSSVMGNKSWIFLPELLSVEIQWDSFSLCRFSYQREHFKVAIFSSVFPNCNFLFKCNQLIWWSKDVFSLPCKLVLRLLRCANISAKYSSLESQNSHSRYSQKRSCFSVLKNARSSLCSSCTRHSTFPLESHLASVCRIKRLCWESISTQTFSRKRDFNGLVLMKWTISTTCVKTLV